MSDTQDHDDEIITEPPDPRAGAEDSVAKVGQRLQEKADALDGTEGDVSRWQAARRPGRGAGS